MRKGIYLIILGFIFFMLFFSNCSTNHSESPVQQTDYASIKTGGTQIVNITTPKGIQKIWTKRIGNNPKIKVLLLAGGPGCTHEYFECFESFLPEQGIEMIYYDQLGCGRSDNPKDTSLWDLKRYVDELDQVRLALGLDSTNFYLLGHSWGGILAMQYALDHPKALKGLIISNMMASCPKYGKYAEEVLSKGFDPKVLDTIRDIEKRKDFSNPKYMELLMPHFYNKHICRIPLDEWPNPMQRAIGQVNQSLYVTMQGPSEFGISGKLTYWDVSDQLKNIKASTLVIGATHDTMDPSYMEWMSKQMPKGSFHLCKNGSHMCMWDDQNSYFDGLLSFLKR